jgi:hypothetical protein
MAVVGPSEPGDKQPGPRGDRPPVGFQADGRRVSRTTPAIRGPERCRRSLRRKTEAIGAWRSEVWTPRFGSL